MKKICLYLMLLFFLFHLPTLFLKVNAQTEQDQVYEAVIQSVELTNKVNPNTHVKVKNTSILISSGDLKGRKFIVQDNSIPTSHEITYKPGDKVIVTYTKGPGGSEMVYITDVARQTPLLFLVFIFLILILVVGRWQGLSSLIGMSISFLIIGEFIVPNILLGNDPLLITFFGALLIIPLTYFISHGLNKKTSIAIISTFITLLLTGSFAYLFVQLAHLSGFDSDEASYLKNLGLSINIQSILLSGIIIGILAVLNDITVSQASVVKSLITAKPTLSVKELYSNAMGVGKDHIASLVNTLILVYAGASLPLFVLFSKAQGPWNLIINQEIVATEIVRTLVSSIGIVAAVPLTTYLAALVYKKKLL